MQGARDVHDQVRVKKQQMRRRALTRRDRLRAAELEETAVALRDVLLDVPEVSRAAVIAAYIGIGSEPGTRPLLTALGQRGIRVLLPVVTPELDLDWAAYDDPDALVTARLGTLEPSGPRLGVEAIGGADAVLVPGLAADRSGIRLGRGGGCYDRALTRIAPEAFSCVLLHDGEVRDEPLPRDRHDQPVRAAAMPSGLLRFPR